MKAGKRMKKSFSSDEIIASRNMDLFYDYAQELIEDGHAYVDLTPAEAFRKLKEKKPVAPR